MATRKTSKSARIASKLRADIIAGRLQPGDTLPTWDSLESEFFAGRPTLTKAMAQLKEDGFIKAKRSQGTFVHDRPPHLTRFGLIFPSHPSIAYTGLGRWNRFWEMLSMMAPVIGELVDLEMPIYYNIGANLGHDEARLREDLQRHRLGGLILVSADTARSPLFDGCTIPRVAVHGSSQDALDCPGLYVDRVDFVDKALAVMKEHGRRRVAVLTDRYFAFRRSQEQLLRTGNEDIAWHTVNDAFEQMMADEGFESKGHWHFMLTPSSVRNTVRLLYDRPADECPDGLIIADDNLTEEALAGLINAGAADLPKVVTHCNWPAPTHPLIPTIGLGYDIRDFLKLCITTLQAIGRGEQVPGMQRLSAQFQPSPVEALALRT